MPHRARPPAVLIARTGRHIGIAMPACEGFEFVVTDSDFDLLDGSRFRRLEQAARSIIIGPYRSEATAVPIRGDGCADRTAQPWKIEPFAQSILNN